MCETVRHLEDVAGRHGGKVPRVSLEAEGRDARLLQSHVLVVVPWRSKQLIVRLGVCYGVQTVTIICTVNTNVQCLHEPLHFRTDID